MNLTDRINLFPEGSTRETQLPKNNRVDFVSSQYALQACLEALGSRAGAIPVVIPVICSPHVVSACLRSGASPFMVDVDPGTLQIDLEAFSEAVSEIQSGIVILTQPAGMDIDSTLLDVLTENVFIVDAPYAPIDTLPSENALFTVFEDPRTELATVHSRYQEQASDLFNIRNSFLGLHAAPFKSQYETDMEFPKGDIIEYAQLLGQDPINASAYSPYVALVRTKNAKATQAYLNDENIESALFSPIHRIPNIASSWEEEPNYPNADLVAETVLALPLCAGKEARRVCDAFLEIQKTL